MDINVTNEDEKFEKRRKKCKKSYDALAEQLSLTGSPVEDVHALIQQGQKLQCEICKASDSIKITDYEEANKLSPIDNATYKEFVSISAKKLDGKLTEKAYAKFEEDFNYRLFITNARHTFLSTYMSDENLKLANDEDTTFEPFEEHESNNFEKILERSAQTRLYINHVLYGQMRMLGEAAEYITNGDLTPKRFKLINDFEYYINGGYPKPETPAKLWSIFNKFNEAYRVMDKYKFTQQGDLCDEFGLDITLNEEHPVVHPWMINDDIDE